MSKQTITVTAEHIASGARGYTGISPIALALGETDDIGACPRPRRGG
jgi:hypothetical protein